MLTTLLPRSVHFWFQHHARAFATGPDTYSVSLFDNGANQYESRAVQARGVVIEVNTRTMDTRLLRQVLPPFHDVCPSEGSVQVGLPVILTSYCTY